MEMVLSKRPAIQTTVPDQVNKVRIIEDELNSLFPERRMAIANLIMATLTGGHILLLSGPGEGKSRLVEAFGQRVVGKWFRHNCSIEDRNPAFFGPLDPSQLHTEGRYVRKHPERFIQAAEYAFLDEFFDVPDPILRGALLSLMNEGIYKTEDGEQTPAPLRSLFAASNFVRARATTEALLDRFQFAVGIEGGLAADSLFQIDQNSNERRFSALPNEQLTVDDVDTLKAHIEEIKVPAYVLMLKAIIAHTVNSKGETVLSTRRIVNLTNLIKASAMLAGRSVATDEDLRTVFDHFTLGPNGVVNRETHTKLTAASQAGFATYANQRTVQSKQLQFVAAVIDGIDKESDLKLHVDLDRSYRSLTLTEKIKRALNELEPVNGTIASFRNKALSTLNE